jgi:flavin-dependent dehydrogenase
MLSLTAVARSAAEELCARAINEGGRQSVPQLTFSGGALIGC